jgi:hypothetical protein
MLPVVLYGCETWSLILREECMLRVFENRVLRRIFGPKREEVTGEMRALCSVTVTKYYSGDQTKNNKMGSACSTYEIEEKYIQDFRQET